MSGFWPVIKALETNKENTSMYKLVLLTILMALTSPLHANQDEALALAKEVSKMPEGEKLDQLVSSLVESQVNINPSIRPIRKAFDTFYREIFSSEEFTTASAKIYLDLFTYEELVELKKLMDTPIFKKYELIMPTYMQRYMELGNEIVMNNRERLGELIKKEQDHIEKLQQLDKELMLTPQQ